MLDKLEIQKKMMNADKEFFDKFGATAMDKYYESAEKRKIKEESIKGGSKELAKTMQDKFSKAQKEQRDRMKKEAEERMKMIQVLQNEEHLKKQKLVEQKRKLKEI